MPHPSKRKGHVYERELFKKLQEAGFRAERAWGSNGAALGEHEEVDLVFTDRRGGRWKVQAKRRKSLPAYLKPHEEVDTVVIREDRGEDLAIVPLYTLLKLIAQSSTR